MSKSAKPTRMEPDDRQAQIIRIAASHFAHNGYDSASMASIAAEAGVTRALVYHYFPTKAALFESVLQSESDALLAATDFDLHLSPLDNIRAAVRAYLEHFSQSRDRAINLQLQADVQPVLVGEVTRANHAVLTQRVVKLLALADDPLIRGAINGWLDFVTTLSREIADEPGIDRESVVNLCIRTLEASTCTDAGQIKPNRLSLLKKRKERP